MKPRLLITLVLAVASASCSGPPQVIPTRNLERPTDMGFACLSVVPLNGEPVLSGRPMRECHPPGAKDPPVDLSLPVRALGTFSFVTNTARGELAAADLDRGMLVDLEPAVFGYGMVPVGTDPATLDVSQDGCWVMTANHDSCDLTLIDPARLLSPTFGSPTPATGVGSPVARIAPKTASGRPLQVSPREIRFLPTGGNAEICQAGVAPLALVTFSSCDLVALVDVTTGTIRDSVFIRADGVVPGGNEPVCPVLDCGASSGSRAPEIDGGTAAGDAGGADALTPGNLGVGALALVPDGTRAYVAAANAEFITALDIVGGSFAAASQRIALEGGAAGVERLRLSVDPFQLRTVALPDGSTQVFEGDFLAGRGRFLYAFARDGSVRVVDIDVPPGQECDVNVVPTSAQLLSSGLPVDAPCFPVTAGLPRRPLAQGPGIRIPLLASRTAAPPLPRDIAFADLQVPPADVARTPQALNGQYGFLLSSDENVYIVNLAPANEPTTPTHSFRELRPIDQATADPLDSNTTPLRTQSAPDLLFPTVVSLSSANGPRLERRVDLIATATATGTGTGTGGVATSPVASATTATAISTDTSVVWASFPDPTTIVSRTFSITWEDLIPGGSRPAGTLLVPATAGTAAGALVDVGAAFCAKDVLTGDLAVLPGCVVDADCVRQELFSCQRTQGGGNGLCLPKNKTLAQPILDNRSCTRFMASRRRYEIARATPTRLDLTLKLDEVPRPSIAPCTPDIDPDSGLEKGGTEVNGVRQCRPTPAFNPSTDGRVQGFQCLSVNPDETPRCVEPCGVCPSTDPNCLPDSPNRAATLDRGCRPGFVCEDTGSQLGKLCVEAPPIDLACWPEPGVPYHLHVGRSFLVSGSMLPDLPTTRVNNGVCEPDPTRNPALANRIPLSAPRCATIPDGTPTGDTTLVVDGAAVFLPGAQNPLTPLSPNPCLYSGKNNDEFSFSATGFSVKAAFENPQIRFVLTNLEQYGGDGLSERLTITDGFSPLVVSMPSFEIAITQPVRILTGPYKTPESPVRQVPPTSPAAYPYLYVVDQGRTAITPNSSGQILRINPRKGDSANPTFDPATSGDTPFQIQ